MKKLLIIHFHNHATQPRVRREYDLLEGKYKLFGMGYVDCQREGVEFIPIKKPKWNWKMKIIQRFWLFFGQYEKVYWNLPQIKEAEEKLKKYEFDIILAHNEETIPLILKYKKNAKIVLNMHEYAPRELENFFWWKIYFSPYKHYLCQTYLKQVDYMYSVSEGIAKEYEKNYGVKCDVITSAAKYHTPPHSLVCHEPIKLIHHGMASKERGIEKMIAMMEYLDSKFTLDLMLVKTADEEYFKVLEMKVHQVKNTRIIPIVPFEEIIPFTSSYDIGLYILQPTNFNGYKALPNKFFEFIQARLAIAIGPSPEMSKLVQQYNLGIIAKDFTSKSMAEELNKLTKQDILKYKENSNKTAKILNAEKEGEKILKILEEVLG